MVLSEEKKREYVRRLLLSRMRILVTNGFYGLLLMHMKFSIDENCETAATDGRRIFFAPEFLDELNDSELDFIMMHEVMHIVLQHCFRAGERDHERYNIACDIVVNSNILLSCGEKVSAIYIKKYGTSMHLAPDGREGYEYTAEEVYEMLLPTSVKKNKTKLQEECKSISAESVGGGSTKSEMEGQGRDKSASVKTEENESTRSDGKEQENAKSISVRNGERESTRSRGKEQEKGKSTPDRTGKNESKRGGRGEQKRDKSASANTMWDDHTRWGTEEEDMLRDVWIKRLENACENISIEDPSNQRGVLPQSVVRLLKQLKQPQIDWRTILNDFIQEEIVDYSFSPPDRRFSDSCFILPDFNDKDEKVYDILFMIDTSGSMSDEMITAAYSEIKGAVDQFNGALEGWVGFFDEPKPFDGEAGLEIIKPVGGGGTDFEIIFDYIHKYMSNRLPSSIIILTDGLAPFPPEYISMGIPVLWVVNNDKINPPWGKVARIAVK